MLLTVFSSSASSSSCCDMVRCCSCSSSWFCSPAVSAVSLAGAELLAPVPLRRSDLQQQCQVQPAVRLPAASAAVLPVLRGLAAPQAQLQLVLPELEGRQQVSPPIPLALCAAGSTTFVSLRAWCTGKQVCTAAHIGAPSRASKLVRSLSMASVSELSCFRAAAVALEASAPPLAPCCVLRACSCQRVRYCCEPVVSFAGQQQPQTWTTADTSLASCLAPSSCSSQASRGCPAHAENL